MANGMQSLSEGEKQAALDAFLQVIKLDATYFDALHLAGVLSAELGDPKKGLELLNAAQAQGVQSPYFSNNYGNVLLAVGDFAKAEEAFDYALMLLPAYPEALSNKANLLLQQDRCESALVFYEQALALDANFADAWANRGVALRELGRLLPAQESLAKALTINPSSPAYHCIYAGLCIELREYQEALNHIDAAITLDEHYGLAYFERGNIHMSSEEYQDARDNFTKASRLKGVSLADIYANLAICSYNLLDTEAVEKHLDKRFELLRDFRARWLHVMTRVPICPETPKKAQDARKKFLRELLTLKDWLSKNGVSDFWKYVGDGVSTFYHVYHNIDDKELLETYASVVKMLMEPLQKEVNKKDPQKNKLRVGVVSANVRDHSVWRDRMLGLYLFKPDDIELYTFSLGIESAAESAIAKAASAYYINEILQLPDLVEKIQECDLDIIYYPELGLSPAVYKVACLRLAPIQLTSWGHPITSGIENIDYYIGNVFLDGHEAQKYYSEKLVLSKSFPTYCPRFKSEDEDYSSYFTDLDFSKKILLAPGSAFKYQFDFASIYADIAEGLEGIQIVFFKYDNIIFERNKAKLIAEFSARGILSSKLVFIDWLDQKKYRYLLQQSHLMLDSLGFSGINTVLQALDAKLPVVTQRGEFLRGRLGSGVLDAAGMEEWVAKTQEEYVNLVCALVQDESLYARYQKDLSLAENTMFENHHCIDEFFEIFRSLHHDREAHKAGSS